MKKYTIVTLQSEEGVRPWAWEACSCVFLGGKRRAWSYSDDLWKRAHNLKSGFVLGAWQSGSGRFSLKWEEKGYEGESMIRFGQ